MNDTDIKMSSQYSISHRLFGMTVFDNNVVSISLPLTKKGAKFSWELLWHHSDYIIRLIATTRVVSI